MERISILLDFLNRVRDDAVMDAKHIAVYMALYKRWLMQGCANPVKVISREVMADAKISSSATYCRKIRELYENKYIGYFPAHSSLKGTYVSLITRYEEGCV